MSHLVSVDPVHDAGIDISQKPGAVRVSKDHGNAFFECRTIGFDVGAATALA